VRDSVGIAVLGAGPAGLSAADVLARREVAATVFEADSSVGGIARTVEHDGFRFDLGGHRFFTKLAPVQALWEETLGDDFLLRPRLSRIYYGGEFFAYPLRAEEVVRRLGALESLRCAVSYLRARLRSDVPPDTFEAWVTARFGRRLYDAFFRTYTEKVWGVPGSAIQSEWAAQRIKNLSFWTALTGALRLRRTHVTSLIEQFHYPRLGPGQMWEAFRERIETAGVPVRLGERCVAVQHADGAVHGIRLAGAAGEREEHVDGLLSSIPLAELVLALEPPAPDHVLEAARSLRYRELVLVGLMSSDPEPFPDNWIYLHDPDVRAGRVQNFGAWSPAMTRPGTTCLGVEYFCFEGDELWTMTEQEAVALAVRELTSIGLLDPEHVLDGIKIQVRRAYPMYVSGYREAVETLRAHLQGLRNLRTFGRNGLHRYNNQDHSMWTGILAALDLLDGSGYDVWSVNSEELYLEEGELLRAEPAVGLVENAA
jgi:protoporphyrinogen oxidase